MPGAHEGQKKVSEPIELELQMIVSGCVDAEVQGAKYWCFARVASALNFWDISLVSHVNL